MHHADEGIMNHDDDLRDRIRRRALGLERAPRSTPPTTRALPPATGTTLHRDMRPSWWRRLLARLGVR